MDKAVGSFPVKLIAPVEELTFESVDEYFTMESALREAADGIIEEMGTGQEFSFADLFPLLLKFFQECGKGMGPEAMKAKAERGGLLVRLSLRSFVRRNRSADDDTKIGKLVKGMLGFGAKAPVQLFERCYAEADTST